MEVSHHERWFPGSNKREGTAYPFGGVRGSIQARAVVDG